MQFISTIYNTWIIFRRNRSNVQLLFQRFENQGRHTVHTHMLVWLKEVTNIDVDHIRASVPKDNTFLAYLVSLLYTFCQFYIIAILKCQLHFMFKQVLLYILQKENFLLHRLIYQNIICSICFKIMQFLQFTNIFSPLSKFFFFVT